MARAANYALMVDRLHDHGVLLGAEGSNQLGLEQILALSSSLSLCSLKANGVLEVAGDAATGRCSEEPKRGLGAKSSNCGAEKASGCQHGTWDSRC